MFLRSLVVVGLGLALFSAPVLAQQNNGGKKSLEEQKKEAEGTEFQFVDSYNGAWVTRGLNDTLYSAGGSFNRVNSERDQVRGTEKLTKMYRPPEVVEMQYTPKTGPDAPPMRINGVVVNVSK